MAQPDLIRPRGRALVDEMQQWRGLEWGPVVLENISLKSAPDAWPARIRLDHRIGSQQARWEEDWGEEFTAAVEDTNAATRLLQQAPDLIGWNADQIVEWIEELAKKL